MIESKKSQIITIVVSIITAILSAYFTSLFETQQVKDDVDALKDQNSILGKELSDQIQKTTIMNQTLHTIQQSLEKRSLISVKILPHTEFANKYAGFNYVLGPGPQYSRQVVVSNESLNLVENKTYQFDIVITNIGGDTAILNYYAFQKVRSGDFGHSVGEQDYDISKILNANSEPLIIKYNFTADRSFLPNGTLYITVVYDNGAAEPGAIPYTMSGQ